MKKTIVVMSSNRQIERQTQHTVQRFREAGALYLLETGSADVAFARCRALSWACEELRNWPERDMVLMMDDDMEASVETAQELTDKARELGPCSAMYATATEKLAAARYPERPGLWLVGLGFVAVPRKVLLELEERSESFEINGKFCSAFTWSGPGRGSQKGGWVAEDFQLSINLGGVHLLPLAVGHIKKGSLWPDEETIEKIRKGETL